MDTETLLRIDEDLTSNEVAQMKFLCTDLVQKKRLETVSDAKDLFLRLEEQGLLDDGLLIPELLITIRRLDLLVILKVSKEKVERDLLACDGYKGVSPYRKMLHSLSEDITKEHLSIVKFLVSLPKSKLGTSSFLDILIAMEKEQILGEDNLDELQNILDKCDKQLASRIEKFKSMHRDQDQVGGRPPLQEVYKQYPEHMESEVAERGERRDSSFGIENLTTDSEISAIDVDGYYTISHRPVGYCLIINNYNFEDFIRSQNLNLRNRKGTKQDEESLKRVFKKMHFEVEVQEDLTASDMLNLMKEFAGRDHSQMDAFVCCVLSHGEKGSVLGVDGQPVEIRELTLPFAQCNTLASKPKLFFIQACQGNVGQEAVWTADGQENSSEEGYEEDAHKVVYYSIPKEADFLIGMATVEHYHSYRHTTEGSIYIQELCKQLENLCPRKEDILSILTKVNCEVSARKLNGYKQMPEPRYTLRKKLVLLMD